MDQLLADIEAFIETHGISHWEFGERAMADKNFVGDLRAGRDIRLSTERRVRQFMLTYKPAAAA